MCGCRLVGCQGLLEEIPGRRKDSLQLLISSPGESKSLLRKKEKTKSYNVKEEMSSKYRHLCLSFICFTIIEIQVITIYLVGLVVLMSRETKVP